MQTEITIQPLPAHARVGGDIKRPRTLTVPGHLSPDEVFAEVYPGAAAKGHTADSQLNGYQRYSYKHL